MLWGLGAVTQIYSEVKKVGRGMEARKVGKENEVEGGKDPQRLYLGCIWAIGNA